MLSHRRATRARGRSRLGGMTSSDNQAGGIRPRPVVDLLPRYAAGKPPVPVEGLVSYKLSSNENPLPPIPAVQQAIAAQADFNRYPDPLSSKLRGALAGFLDVPAEDIVTGAESVQVPLLADGRHDLDAMAAAVTARTRVILLCTPNNPTGPILTTEETERFIKAVPSDVVVVIDEAYQEFVRAEDGVDVIRMYRKYPNVVVLRTFSKAHGLAGLRVGYSVSQPELTQHLRVAATPFAVSQIAEAAAVTSLQHFGEVVERVQSLVDERDRVTAGLRELGWFVPDAQGNFVWLNLGANSAEFAALAGERALSVRAFGTEGVRVSIGEAEANTRFLELCAIYTKPPQRS